MKITPKRRQISIPGFKFLNFCMLTHVCGVARGPLPHAIAAHMRQHEKIEKLEAQNQYYFKLYDDSKLFPKS